MVQNTVRNMLRFMVVVHCNLANLHLPNGINRAIASV